MEFERSTGVKKPEQISFFLSFSFFFLIRNQIMHWSIVYPSNQALFQQSTHKEIQN